MIKQLEYPTYANSKIQRISWGAVFAGTIVSLATMVLCTTVGAGIGLAAAPSAAASGGTGAAMGYGIGAGAWMLLSGIASFYAGGWFAGRLTGNAREGVIHGLVSWGLTTVMVAFVFTSATAGALGAASGALSSALGRSDVSASEGPGSQPLTGTVNTADVAKASKAAGAASLFASLMLVCDAAASGFGARSGSRGFRHVSSEHRTAHGGHSYSHSR